MNRRRRVYLVAEELMLELAGLEMFVGSVRTVPNALVVGMGLWVEQIPPKPAFGSKEVLEVCRVETAEIVDVDVGGFEEESDRWIQGYLGETGCNIAVGSEQM